LIPSKRHRELFVPEEEIKHRLQDLQLKLQAADIDVAVIEHKTDIYYFSGSAQTATLIVPASGEAQYLVKRSFNRAREESPLNVERFKGSKDLYSRINNLLGKNGRLGMSLDVTSAAQYLKTANMLDNTKIVDISLAIRLIKSVKSDWELVQVKKATAQVEPAFKLLPDLIIPGTIELDISAEIEAILRKSGHPGPIRIRRPGLDLAMILVTAGDSACYPHSFDGPVGGEAPDPISPAGSGYRPLKEGDTLIADIVTSYNGYHSDNARCFVVGDKVDSKTQKAHDFCLDILNKMEQSILPGISCEDVYREVAAFAKDQGEPEGFMGFGDNRVKFFGHGVGLELDEFPIIADRVKIELVEGMVMALEPKAFLAGVGPVGVENTYILTKDGLQNLCKTSQQLRFC